MKNLLLDKKNLLIIFSLLAVTIVVNWFVFSKQLDYGFRDVDWYVLYYFKLFDGLSLTHLPQALKVLGVYISESYYVGLLEKLFGIDFVHLHQVTQFFKAVAAISVYLVILKIFKRKLLAFISSLIYTLSYTHAGVLFQLSSGGYFLTTIFMNSFLITYYYSLVGKSILKWSALAGILLIFALLMKPERMFPLIPLILIVEFIKTYQDKFKKDLLMMSLKRTLTIFLPIIIFSFFYIFLLRIFFPTGFAPDQFFINSKIRIDYIANGNWQLLLYPFASLGSIFLYEDYWKLLGQLNFGDLGSYIISLIFGPVLRLGLLTFILLPFIYKRSFKLTLAVMFSIFTFGLLIYILSINWRNLIASERIYFDPSLVAVPAISGFYLLALMGIFFIEWLKTKDTKYSPLILGLFFAILFVLLTWIPSDIQLVFMGPQRYLSIPSIGTGLFIAGLLVIIYDRIKAVKAIRNFAPVIFLLLIPLIIINYQVASKFFDYELTYAGLRGSEQTRMKNKFRQLVGKISQEEKSLFYFDETMDKENGYFDEGTVMAGFEYWIRVNMDGSLNNFPEPGMMRTNIQCPQHSHQNCISVLKAGLAVVDGQPGIWYQDPIRRQLGRRFFKLSNFYAFRFINKQLIDISAEVLRELNL